MGFGLHRGAVLSRSTRQSAQWKQLFGPRAKRAYWELNFLTAGNLDSHYHFGWANPVQYHKAERWLHDWNRAVKGLVSQAKPIDFAGFAHRLKDLQLDDKVKKELMGLLLWIAKAHFKL